MTRAKVSFLLPGYTPDGPASTGTVEGDDDTEFFASRSAFSFTQDDHQEPWQSQMATALGFDTACGKKLPAARLGFVGDVTSSDRDLPSCDSLLRADPVFLKADKDSARLIPADQLQLSEDEADALLTAINDFLSSDGLEFFRRATDEWYISGMSAGALESYPPSFLANRNASTFLPEGEAMADWRRLLTELQMLLHSHTVNQHREARGLMPVNSVWFWGGGSLPVLPESTPSVEVFAEHQQALEMSRYCKVACRPLSEFSSSTINQLTAEHTVILDTRLVNAWLEADASQLEKILLDINSHWLEPCIEGVRLKAIAQLSIGTEDGLYGICNQQTLASEYNNASRWFTKLTRLFKR